MPASGRGYHGVTLGFMSREKGVLMRCEAMRRRVGVALFSLMAVLALSLVSAPPAHAQTIRESEPNNALSQADALSPNATVCGVSTDSIDYECWYAVSK